MKHEQEGPRSAEILDERRSTVPDRLKNVPTVCADEELLVISFDGSACVERDLLGDVDRGRLVVCGDSNLVIRQVRGEIDYKAPNLVLLKQKILDRLRIWPDHELLHVKRDWNGSADSLAGVALQRQGGIVVENEGDHQDLSTLNRLDEILVVRSDDQVARVSPVATRSDAGSIINPTVLQEEFARGLRTDLIQQVQAEDTSIVGMNEYLEDNVANPARVEDVRSNPIETGSEVWLYLSRVKEGYFKKLAHQWHGPFRVAKKINEYTMKLQVNGTKYDMLPTVHVSKLKSVKEFPDRPQIALKEGEVDQPNFDEIWLPEDSWVPDRDSSEHGVGKITDMRTDRRTRYGRSYRECLANLKGYDATDWTDETDLNCEALMHEFLRDRSYQKQFDMLQFREEE
ncbi:hypothetical protein PR003_g28407 [Phytophthora rubi]|uniref:RNase H type-1 domain-containing protein n=1 Tax=Phytophthora rubi TaxID=129364 RepID=A0A6A4C044_9STRA|nr:hypothetical protein PR003_g28407 [Phytophthora rubi]